MQLPKDFLIIFFGKIIQVIIVIAILKVSTMLLTPEQIGIMYIFLSIQTFFVFTFISPIGQYINRKTHSWDKNNTIWNNLFLFSLYIFIIGLLSILLGIIFYDSFMISNTISLTIFLYLIFGFIIFISLNQTIIPMLNLLHFRLSFTILTILTSFGILFFGYFFIHYNNNGSISWLNGILLSNIIFLIIGYIVLRNRINSKFKGIKYNLNNFTKDKIFNTLKIVLPISLATLLMWVQNNGYRFIVEENIGLEFLGFLGVGLAIASQISSVVESILTQYLSPIYYQKIANASLEERVKTFNWLLNIQIPIYLLLALYVTFLAPYIIDILVDKRYASVYIFTIFGIWVEFFRMTTNVFYTVSLSELKTKKVILPYFIGSFLSLILVYISSKHINYEIYIPLSLLCGGLLTMIMMNISMKKLLNFSIDYKVIFIVLLLSLPYFTIFILDNNDSFMKSLFIVVVLGSYFLYTIYILYLKKGVLNDNS